MYLFRGNKFEPLIGRREEIDGIKDVITLRTEFKQNHKRNTRSATRQHMQICLYILQGRDKDSIQKLGNAVYITAVNLKIGGGIFSGCHSIGLPVCHVSMRVELLLSTWLICRVMVV